MTEAILTDHTATIRAQIERDVLALRATLEQKDYWTGGDEAPDGDVRAQYVELGYFINTHHGKPIYAAGDVICGLSVRISTSYPRVVRVCADNVPFMQWSEEQQEWVDPDQPNRRNLHEQTIW